MGFIAWTPVKKVFAFVVLAGVAEMLELSSKALFARTDDGAGGWLQTLKRRIKFEWRYTRYGHQLRQVHQTLQHHGITCLLDSEPNLLLRPLRSYLWNELDGIRRTRALQSHLHWLLQSHGSEVIKRLYHHEPAVLMESPLQSHQMRLLLQPGRGLGREGELALVLQLDGEPVMQCAFSVLPVDLFDASRPSGHLMVIGNLQGVRDGSDRIRQFTHAAERTRPHTILMTALQGLASGWQLAGILGVTSERHAYSGYRSLSKRVGIDYDALWQELGATSRMGYSHWQLPLELHLRDDQEVPSRKRAEHRRRSALRLQIRQQCKQSAAALTQGMTRAQERGC